MEAAQCKQTENTKSGKAQEGGGKAEKLFGDKTIKSSNRLNENYVKKFNYLIRLSYYISSKEKK